MTREEWIKEKEQLCWEWACLIEEEMLLVKKREELMVRSEQLNSHEPEHQER